MNKHWKREAWGTVIILVMLGIFWAGSQFSEPSAQAETAALDPAMVVTYCLLGMLIATITLAVLTFVLIVVNDIYRFLSGR